jgi:hypothetical protein
MAGGLLGFLFGIPRYLATPEKAPPVATSTSAAAVRAATYGDNTNLEQISDWLTKILVGVGLTQLNAIPDKLGELAAFLSPAFADSGVFAVGAVLYFSIAGFLFGYLWTRLFMRGALKDADDAAAAQMKSEREQQAEYDAKAITLVRQHLTPSAGAAQVSEEELKNAISKASKDQRLMIRQLAMGEPRAERAVPLLRAIIGGDEDSYFDDHAQLAYRLKDQREPDWAGAEAELTTAIRLRGPMDPTFGGYELHRALSRIGMEDQTKPSSNRDAIVADLKTAVRDPAIAVELPHNDTVQQWMTRNSVLPADLGL